MIISDSSELQKINDLYDTYKEKAKEQYPDNESKKTKLDDMNKKWKKARRNSLSLEGENTEDKTPNLVDFKYMENLEKIHILWYPSFEGIEYNTIVTNKTLALSNSLHDNIEDFIGPFYTILEEDPIEEGDWVLGWKCNNDGTPNNKNILGWTQINYVISNGAIGDDYTKIICEGDSATKPPFDINNNNRIKQIIIDTLLTNKFPELLPKLDNNDHFEKWRVEPADKVVPSFIKYIKEEFRKL